MIGSNIPIDRNRLESVCRYLRSARDSASEAGESFDDVSKSGDRWALSGAQEAFESAARDTEEVDSSRYGNQASDDLSSLADTRRGMASRAGDGRSSHESCSYELRQAMSDSYSGVPDDVRDRIEDALDSLSDAGRSADEEERALDSTAGALQSAENQADAIRDDEAKDEWSPGRDVSGYARDGAWALSDVGRGFDLARDSAYSAAGGYGRVQDTAGDALALAESHLAESRWNDSNQSESSGFIATKSAALVTNSGSTSGNVTSSGSSSNSSGGRSYFGYVISPESAWPPRRP